MGWYTMPDSVQESAFERQIKEGKAYQISEEFSIPAGQSRWVYIQMSPDKEVILESRNIAATAGPVRYKVYPGAQLIGPLGTEIIPEKLNNVKNGPPLSTLHRVDETSLNISGITPSDKHLVPAGQDSGSRGTGSSIFQSFFKIYERGTIVAVSLSNAASITAIVELVYIWVEDVE